MLLIEGLKIQIQQITYNRNNYLTFLLLNIKSIHTHIIKSYKTENLSLLRLVTEGRKKSIFHIDRTIWKSIVTTVVVCFEIDRRQQICNIDCNSNRF